MNSSPRPYLKSTRRHSTQRGIEQHLLVLDVDALDRADPLGEVEGLGLGERLCRVPAPLALPDHGRIEALLDRRPDRERGREVVAVDDEVCAVADPDQVDLGEELVRRVAGEHVGEAGLDADPDERQQSALAPALLLRELRVAELLARLRVREGHRHVEVGAARVEGRREDGLVEAGVDGVQDRVGALRARRARRSAPRRRRRPGRRRSAGRPSRSTTAWARRGSTSAKTIRSKTSRRLATAAAAAPTPPDPTTSTRTGRTYRLRGRCGQPYLQTPASRIPAALRERQAALTERRAGRTPRLPFSSPAAPSSAFRSAPPRRARPLPRVRRPFWLAASTGKPVLAPGQELRGNGQAMPRQDP